jgi:hypothetical protein
LIVEGVVLLKCKTLGCPKQFAKSSDLKKHGRLHQRSMSMMCIPSFGAFQNHTYYNPTRGTLMLEVPAFFTLNNAQWREETYGTITSSTAACDIGNLKWYLL